MMKKILTLALSSLMVLGLAACGNTNSADTSSNTSKKDGYGGPGSGQGQWQDVGRLLFGWRPYEERRQLYR